MLTVKVRIRKAEQQFLPKPLSEWVWLGLPHTPRGLRNRRQVELPTPPCWKPGMRQSGGSSREGKRRRDRSGGSDKRACLAVFSESAQVVFVE